LRQLGVSLHAGERPFVYSEEMARHLACLAPLLVVLCAAGIARDSSYPCEAPEEIRSLAIEQVRSRIGAGQDDFFLYKRLLDLTPSVPKPGALAPQFLMPLLANPDADGRMIYLYGRALIGKDTQMAIVKLNDAARKAHALPFTYSALAEIYASRNFGDAEKLLENIREYRSLCPANLDGFRYFDKIADAGETGAWARELRPLLEKSTDPEDGQYWRLLWAAEFRIAPQSDYDTLRTKVAADVKRLEGLPRTGSREQIWVLWDGYKLSGRMDAADRIEREQNASPDFHRVLDAWYVKTGLRGGKPMTDDERQAVYREYAKVTAEWVARWPDLPDTWSIRLASLPGPDGVSNEELERVGDQYLKLIAARPVTGWTYVPPGLSVAWKWALFGIRPRDSVRMAEEALAQIQLGPEEPNDLNAPPNAAELVKMTQFGFGQQVWGAMSTIVDKARGMLATMRLWLNQNEFKKDDRTTLV
jgi:hypothetical protein